VKNIEGSCPKETHESQPLLSPSGDSKIHDWLRWHTESQIQERSIRRSRTHSDIIRDYQTQKDIVKHRRTQSDPPEYGWARQDKIPYTCINNKDLWQINSDLSKAKFDQSLLTETNGLTLYQKEDLFKAALQSPYHEVLDSSRKVIFTENDYHYYQECKDQIVTVLNKEHEAEELIGSLQKISFFKDLYNLPVGVSEGYTLGEHTSMVLEQFKRYQKENWESSLLTANDFQLMLAIHDIGKPQAVLETGDKSKQHEYNHRIIPEFVNWLGIPEEKRKLIVALTMQDHIGGFLQKASYMISELSKKQEARKIGEKILKEAAQIGIEIEHYFDLTTCYYRADAGSYTTDADPAKGNLNYLFEEKTDLGCTRAFSEGTQKNYDILASEIKSIALRRSPLRSVSS
jgi:hypothetical protein